VANVRRLTDGGARTVRDLVAGLGLDAAPAAAPGRRTRPRVVADMVASVDGRAAVQGRSVALGHPADRALLRELRTAADAILVGAETLAAERYADLLDDEQRARRAADGRPAHPVIATISRRLTLPAADAPVLMEPGVPVVVFTEAAEAPEPALGADLEVVRLPGGALTLVGVLEELAARGVRGVLCEGGPSLLRLLVAERAVDDVLLTVAPLLAAGDAPAILEGEAFTPDPAVLTLREVHRADDHVFLHYGLQR
jgi:riboflavin biosynthesis pyrimidine reductase